MVRYAASMIARSLPAALVIALSVPLVCAAASAPGSQASTKSAASTGAIPVTVTTVAGQELNGSMTSWTAAGLAIQVASPSGEERVEIANAQLLQVVQEHAPPTAPLTVAPPTVAPPTVAPPTVAPATVAPAIAAPSRRQVVLVDGSRLPMTKYEVADGKASIWSPLVPDPLILATEHIARVHLLSGAEGAAAIRKRLDQERLVGDVLVLKKKAAAAVEFLTGVVGNVSAEKVDFQWEGERIPVKLGKIAALAYYHAQTPPAARLVCVLTTRDGAWLPAARIRLTRGVVQLTTVGGLDLAIPIEAIHQADYSRGKLAYLSDLTPIYQKWTPRIGLPAAAALIRLHGLPRIDQSYSGSTLSLLWPKTDDGSFGGEAKVYAKGLALRSRTVVRYRIPEAMSRFICLAGIDPATSEEGNVDLTISVARGLGGAAGAATERSGSVADGSVADAFGETRQLWHGEIAGGAAPVEIDVELGGARELQLHVDYGSNLDFGDRLHLVEARVSK